MAQQGFLGVVELCSVEATKRSWSKLATEATGRMGFDVNVSGEPRKLRDATKRVSTNGATPKIYSWMVS